MEHKIISSWHLHGSCALLFLCMHACKLLLEDAIRLCHLLSSSLSSLLRLQCFSFAAFMIVTSLVTAVSSACAACCLVMTCMHTIIAWERELDITPNGPGGRAVRDLCQLSFSRLKLRRRVADVLLEECLVDAYLLSLLGTSGLHAHLPGLHLCSGFLDPATHCLGLKYCLKGLHLASVLAKPGCVAL